jgi:hypothetical protein
MAKADSEKIEWLARAEAEKISLTGNAEAEKTLAIGKSSAESYKLAVEGGGENANGSINGLLGLQLLEQLRKKQKE